MALGRETVWDVTGGIRRRIATRSLLVLPKVAPDLAVMADHEPVSAKRTAAIRRFSERRAWGFKMAGYVPLGDEFVRRAVDALRPQGLIDQEEVNASMVPVEPVALDCSVLLTGGEHVRSVDFERLVFELRRFDLSCTRDSHAT